MKGVTWWEISIVGVHGLDGVTEIKRGLLRMGFVGLETYFPNNYPKLEFSRLAMIPEPTAGTMWKDTKSRYRCLLGPGCLLTI